METMEVRALTEIRHKVHGRTTGRLTPLTMFWTGSALELNVRGSELWIEIEAGYNHYEPWISMVINSVPVSRQMVTSGRHWVCVFRGMNANAVKNVKVIKDTQAMSGDPGCYLHVHAVRSDGEFLPVEDKPYRIEFIGDSITSGEGAIGARQEEDWIPMWFSAVDNYATMAAEALDADYRILSQSGWGVRTGWDNNPDCNMPAYYEQVCGLLTGERNEALGALEQNDFALWQPDVVVVNLGTNDGSAILNLDAALREEGIEQFERAARDFLAKLRGCNRGAHIVWVYGMLGLPMMPAIFRAVDGYKKETGDRHVSVFQLPNTTEETVGARMHPGAPAHRRAAEELSRYLRQLLPRG
jgi:hypothetical protein